MRTLLTFFGTLISSLVFAQVQQYEGQAFWFPYRNAVESFSYGENDSTRKPVGEYKWKLNRETEIEGEYELASITARFRNGLPQGAFELVSYHLNIFIDNFDHSDVHATTTGKKTVIKGAFDKGVPSGTWRFESNPYGSNDEASQVLSFDYETKTWKFYHQTSVFAGQTNAEGFFDGKWQWVIGDSVEIVSEYEQGILTAFKQDGASYWEEALDKVKLQISEVDSIAPPLSGESWAWTDGVCLDDEICQAQKPFVDLMHNALFPFYIGKYYIDRHKLFDMPMINGTNRLYFKLSEENKAKLMGMNEQLYLYDSLLNEKLSLPVFQLRRPTNESLDSLMNVAEAFLGEGEYLKDKAIGFMGNGARYLSPKYLRLKQLDSVFQSHEDFVSALLQTGSGHLQNIQMVSDELEEKKEFLREQGVLEELEEEWSQNINEIKEKHRPGSSQVLAETVFQRFVMEDFEKNRKTYGQLGNISEKRAFLIPIVDQTQQLLSYFKDEEYEAVTLVYDEFVEGYTKYLYNPYMGVDNVEVVVKKRFLSKVINEFWPWLVDRMKNCQDLEGFLNLHQQALDYKEALLTLPDQKSPPAKRLERRGRKAKEMVEIERLLKIYMESLEKQSGE